MLKVKSALYVAKTYLYLLGEGRKRLPFLWISVLLTSLLDVIGVGLVVPFLAVVTNPDSILEASWAEPFAARLESLSHEMVVGLFGAIFISVFLLKSFISARLYLSIAAFAFKQDTSMRVRLLSNMLHTSYEYHLVNDRARILNVLVQNINRFSFSLLALLRMLSELVVVIFLIALLLLASPLVFIVLIITLPIISLVFFYLTRGEAKKWGDLSVESNRDMVKSIQESIEGLKEIRTLGIEQAFIKRLGRSGELAEKSAIGLSKISILPRYVLEGGFVTLIVILVIAVIASEEDLSQLLPMLALVGLAGLRLLPSVNVILSSVSVVRYSFPAVKQIRKDLEDTHNTDSHNLCHMEVGSEDFKTLSLKAVSFAYAGTKTDVLSNVTFDLNRKQSVGIIGGSGAGKTTLVDLILGLLSPIKGEVLVNGLPIKSNLSLWRNMVAYIPQTPFLSDDTVRCNIALGVSNESIDERKLDNAIAASQLKLFIDLLPEGKNTIIGDRGIRLSGGQRQRIAIARALYFDRQVLVFDEATSALDTKTEKDIVDAIGALHGSKTMIIISHRMSTLAHCDRIIEIKDGHVFDLGASLEGENIF